MQLSSPEEILWNSNTLVLWIHQMHLKLFRYLRSCSNIEGEYKDFYHKVQKGDVIFSCRSQGHCQRVLEDKSCASSQYFWDEGGCGKHLCSWPLRHVQTTWTIHLVALSWWEYLANWMIPAPQQIIGLVRSGNEMCLGQVPSVPVQTVYPYLNLNWRP